MKRASLRTAALKMLGELDIRPDFGDPERAKLVLSLIDDPDPDVAMEAVNAAVEAKLPGAEGKLVALLRSGRAEKPYRVAEQLAEIVQDPEAIRLMLDQLLDGGTVRNEQSIGWKLRRLIENPDPKISQPVRDAYRRYLLERYTGDKRYGQTVAHNLAMVADEGTIPVLEDIDAHVRDDYSRREAVEAVARLRPAESVDRLLKLNRSCTWVNSGIAALRDFATEKDAPRIIAVPRSRARGSGRSGSPAR